MEAPPIAAHRLFQGVSAQTLEHALDQCSRLEFPAGSVIYSPRSFRRCLALLLRGRVRVSKDELVVSILQAGDLFGAAALFGGGEDYAGTLTALTGCAVLFVPQQTVLFLLRESPAFAENYARYLTGRIRFLSHRVDALSAGTAVQKLAQFLLSNMDGENTLVLSASALCRRLGMSRASLYRAFDALETAGAIRRTQKQITVLDPEKLNF